MIEGLRYLPELQAQRDKDTQNGLPPHFLLCEHCPEADRALLACGFLPLEEHVGGMRPFPEAAVCPGYTTRLPEVVEAARALSWSKRGGLVPLYGSRELPACAVDAIDCLESAAGAVERRIVREAREEHVTRG